MKRIRRRGRVLGSSLSLGLLLTLTGTAVNADEAEGKKEFIAQKCNVCHSISSEEITHTSKIEKLVGPDLAGIAERREAPWLRTYIQREQLGDNGKKHAKPFKGSDEELQAIVTWLGTLKTPPASP